MVILYAMLSEDPSIELYYPLVVFLVLIPAAMSLFINVRTAIGYYAALVAGLLVGDAIFLLSMILSGGDSPGEAGLAFLVIGFYAVPVGFVLVFLFALVFLPKELLKSIPGKYRACAFAASLLLVIVPVLFGKNRVDTAQVFGEMVRNMPESLNNKRVGDFFLNDENLILENRVFEKVEFTKSSIQNMTIRNVTFKNCLFKQSNFEKVRLENVIFENCTFARLASKYSDRVAAFEAVVCENVIFSGGRLDYLRFTTPDGGSVTVKNVTLRVPKEDYRQLFGGAALNLRIDNCVFDGDTILAWTEGRNQASLHVTNSRFIIPKRELFICSDLRAVWLENCHFQGGHVPVGETTVIRNCHLAAGVIQKSETTKQGDGLDGTGRKQTIYVENCEFPAQRTPFGDMSGTIFSSLNSENDIYILGKAPLQKNVHLGFSGGRMHIFDAEVNLLYNVGGIMGRNWVIPAAMQPASLTLKNVVLDGGLWKNEYAPIDLRSIILVDSTWDTVRIFPQVNMEDADIRSLTVHDLQFPKGQPWVNANPDTFSAMKTSETPLDIPRPRIPTLEELGFVK